MQSPQTQGATMKNKYKKLLISFAHYTYVIIVYSDILWDVCAAYRQTITESCSSQSIVEVEQNTFLNASRQLKHKKKNITKILTFRTNLCDHVGGLHAIMLSCT